jgi:uncharacterized protein YbjQ (UPF0145 family)
MLVTTTNTLEGTKIAEYFGICSGEAICGANVFRDMFAGVRDFVGGRSGAYEKVLREGKEIAIEDMCDQAKELGANAVIAVDIDYEVVGEKGSMLMVAVSGTAVRIE